jgi:hypothetical protein
MRDLASTGFEELRSSNDRKIPETRRTKLVRWARFHFEAGLTSDKILSGLKGTKNGLGDYIVV